MAKITVSIISKQALPTAYFVKNHIDADKHIFLITNEMHHKGYADDIKSATNIKEYVEIFIKDTIADISSELAKYDFNFAYNDVHVNVTGGTKIMFLAVYQFFAQKRCHIYYLDSRSTNFLCIYPEESVIQSNNTLSLAEYMTSYGNSITGSSVPYKPYEIVVKFKNECFDSERYRGIISKLVAFQNDNRAKRALSKNAKSLYESAFEDALYDCGLSKDMQLLSDIFCVIGEDIKNVSLKAIKFITGGWFEEYVYYNFLYVADKLILPDNIAYSLKVMNTKSKSDNELDVSFIYNNVLCVIECKTSIKKTGGESGNILVDTIYKQAALNTNFGLTPKSYLFIYEQFENEAHSNRAKLFNIKLISGERLSCEEQIRAELMQIIKPS